MKSYIDARGNQWAGWVLSGVRIGPQAPKSWSVGRMMGVPGAVSNAPDPAALLEWEFDRAVAQLPDVLKKVTVAHYLSWLGRDQREFEDVIVVGPVGFRRLETVPQKAEACDLSVAAFYRRLDQARSRLHEHLTRPPSRHKRDSWVLKW